MQAHQEEHQALFRAQRQAGALLPRGGGRLLQALQPHVPAAPPSKTRTLTSITPTFNADRKHYTYSFLLPSAPLENDQQLEADHRKRVAEALQEIEEIVSAT